MKIQVKERAKLPIIRLYKLSKEAEDGMRLVIDQMVEQGILRQVVSSPCNSPVMGIKKPSGKWRIVQDLRWINDIVVPGYPVVPNPAVILFQIPQDAEWFTVIDLCQAFFSIPLHKDSQYLFGFSFLDKVYVWCRIQQGFLESPSISTQILKKDLE